MAVDPVHSESGTPAEPRRRAWPLKWIVASVVVLVIVLMTALVVAVGWSGARASLLLAANRAANDAAASMNQRATLMVQPAQATLRLLARDSLAEAGTLQQRLARLGTLADLLAWNSLASAIFVGYADGSFLLVRALDQAPLRQMFDAPPRSNFLVQSIQVDAAGQPHGDYLFLDAKLQLLEQRAQPNYRFDPRQRPWYQASSRSGASLVSEPYRFFTTQQLGLTLSQSNSTGTAVFGIDVVLSDLTNSLAELRISPGSQMVLVDDHNQVLAHSNPRQTTIQAGEAPAYHSVRELGVPSLERLYGMNTEPGKVAVFDADGHDWLGVAVPFDAWKINGLRVLMAVPVTDLLGDLQSQYARLIFTLLLLAALLLPLGWWAGATVGKSLDQVTAQAKRFGRFDFSPLSGQGTVVQEVQKLTVLMNDMGQTIQTFLLMGRDLAAEPDVERMLTQVLQHLVLATHCDAGAVHLWQTEAQHLRCAAVVGEFADADVPPWPALPSQETSLLRRELASGRVELRVALYGRKGQLEGVLVLQHANDRRHADPAFLDFVRQLSSVLAVSIETRQLMQAQKQLLDGVVRILAHAVDAKSPHTGSHCERVPELAVMLIDQLAAETHGPYADFQLSAEERYEFQLGAWLHDCGKVTTPEHIIDKGSKLEVLYNRIHEVRMRFEVLWRDAELRYWQGLANGGAQAELSQALSQRQQALQDDFAFLAACNVPGESMAEADVQRLQGLARQTWLRHFDNRLGLSQEEASRLRPEPVPTLPVPEPLLADRPEHIVPWGQRKPPVEKADPRNRDGFDMALPAQAQNMGELYNLSVRRGTLTEEDRFMINEHIVHTLLMLRGLPWPAQLAKVPDIAATHHEKLDGTGYPRRLQGPQLSLADRVMALADIFEALTAADRPYKSANTLSEALRIMARLAHDQQLDPDLYRYFLHSGLWRRFADKFLLPEQIDEVDIVAIDALMPQAAPVQCAG